MKKAKVSKYGQWKYPGQDTIIPNANGSITMKGVPYPVLGIDDQGNQQMMMPGVDYQFPGNSVYEIPMVKKGGSKKVKIKSLPKAQYGNQKDVERSWANSGRNSNMDVISRGNDTAPFLFTVNTDVIDVSNPNRWSWKNAPTFEPVTLDLNDPNYNKYKQWETVYNLDQLYMPWLVNRLNDPSIPLNEKSHGPNWLPGRNGLNEPESYKLYEIYDSRFLDEPYIKNNYDLSLLNDFHNYGDLMTENQYDFANEGLPIWAVTVDKDSTARDRKFDYLHQFFEIPPPTVYLKGKDLKPTTIAPVDIQPQLQNMAPLADGSKVQRVIINTPQGDMVRVQDPKTKKFIRWETVSGESIDSEDTSTGNSTDDFPQMRRIATPAFAYGGFLPKAQTNAETARQASNRLARRQQWLSRNPRNVYYTDIDEFTRANQAEADSLDAAGSTYFLDMMINNQRTHPNWSWHDPRSSTSANSSLGRFNPAPGRGSIANQTIRPQRVRYESFVDETNTPYTIRVNDYKWPEIHAVYKEEIKPKMIEAKPFIIPQIDIKPQLANIPELPIPKGSKKQRVVVNTPQGDMVRVQDPKSKKFIRWEYTSGESVDFEKKPTGNATDDFPEMKKIPTPKFNYGGGLPKAQSKSIVPIKSIRDFTIDQLNHRNNRYNYYEDMGWFEDEAWDNALQDAQYFNTGPILDFQTFLPASDSGVRVPSGKRYPLEYIDINTYDPESLKLYYNTKDEVNDFYKNWYSKRAQLPQFTEVANKRLAGLNSIEVQPYGSNEEYIKKHPGTSGIYLGAPWLNRIDFPASSFDSPLTLNHEVSHYLDYNFPQNSKGLFSPSYNKNDEVLNNIIPPEYKVPYGGLEGLKNYFATGDINFISSSDNTHLPSTVKKNFANASDAIPAQNFFDSPESFTDYFYNPTEIRARLNEWRMKNNIDPTKDYTNEEIQNIIDKDIERSDSTNFDLYKLVRGRGDLLKKIHDSQVSTGNKENPDEMPKAKRGLRKAQAIGVKKPNFNQTLNIPVQFQQAPNFMDVHVAMPKNSGLGDFTTHRVPSIYDAVKSGNPSSMEEAINKYLGYPMDKAYDAADRLAPEGEDPIDSFRHPAAAMYTQQAIKDKVGVPILGDALGFLGANASGIGHEISTLFKDERPWDIKLREAGEDAVNNFAGSVVGLLPGTQDQKANLIYNMSLSNWLPDGVVSKDPNKNMYLKDEQNNVRRDTPTEFLNKLYSKKQGGSLRKAQNGLPKDYEKFLKYSETAPENRRPDSEWQYGNPRQYDHYGMWDALGKPENFDQALEMNPHWQPDPYDGMYHGFSTNPNTGVWLKSHIPGESHPGDTGWMEYKDFMLSNDRNWGSKNQNLVYDPELQRMRYVERKKQGGVIRQVKIKSLPKAQITGELSKEKQEALDREFRRQQAKAWDPNELNGAQEVPTDNVVIKPMVIGLPAKTPPKKSKEQIAKEAAVKQDKKAKNDPTLWLLEHPEYMLDADGNPVLKSSMEANAPAEYLTEQQKALKEKFIRERNEDPLQQSLGTLTDENKQTAGAAERYANTELATPLLEKNPRSKYATRAEWIESFTPQERAIIQNSNKGYKFNPNVWTTFSRALQTEANKDTEWQRNLDLTQEEKNRPVTKMDRLGLLAPLAVPAYGVQRLLTGDYKNLSDLSSGDTPKPYFGDDGAMRDYYQPDAQSIGTGLWQAALDPLNAIGGEGIGLGMVDDLRFAKFMDNAIAKSVNEFSTLTPNLRVFDPKVQALRNISGYGKGIGNGVLPGHDDIFKYLAEAERTSGVDRSYLMGLSEDDFLRHRVLGNEIRDPEGISINEDLFNNWRATENAINARVPLNPPPSEIIVPYNMDEVINLARRNASITRPTSITDRLLGRISDSFRGLRRVAGDDVPISQVRSNFRNYRASDPGGPMNKSLLGKNETKALLKDKSEIDKLEKLSDSEFRDIVISPDGRIKFPEKYNGPKQTTKIEIKDWVDEFNGNLDLLNRIIAENNTSGREYWVTGITEDGVLKFRTADGRTSSMHTYINPGKFRGEIQDIADESYMVKEIPGLQMAGASPIFGDAVRGTGTYKSLNEYLKKLDLGRVKSGMNTQSNYSRPLWENAIKKGDAFGFYASPGTVYGIMKKEGGTKKKKPGFQVLTDADGKYVFVKT